MDPLLASIILFAGNFAPRGWAFCQGQLLPISQNQALFSLLGTTYGGNGQTTFALPDLRGRAPIGMGQGPGLSNIDLGQSGGAESVTLTSSQMPSHTHALNAVTDNGDGSTPTNSLLAHSGALDKEFKANTNGNTTMHPTAIGAAGGSQPASIVSPYLGMNYIIALQGVFPSRD